MKKPHSFSLDVELTMLLKRYNFINWSQVVTAHLRKHIEKYGTELEKLFETHKKMEEERGS